MTGSASECPSNAARSAAVVCTFPKTGRRGGRRPGQFEPFGNPFDHLVRAQLGVQVGGGHVVGWEIISRSIPGGRVDPAGAADPSPSVSTSAAIISLTRLNAGNGSS